MSNTDLVIRSEFTPATGGIAELWAEEMGGATAEFVTVSTPTAGGTTWEVPDEDPTKILTGVAIDDFEAHTLYLKEYSGENNPPDGYWIGPELQYLTDAARDAGFDERSYLIRGDKRITNRQLLFLARENSMIPLRIDLSGASCRPWKAFKQNHVVGRGKRVCEVVVDLALESRKYASGYSGSVLAPTLKGGLTAEAEAFYLAQREQIRPFSRVRTAPVADEGGAYDASNPLVGATVVSSTPDTDDIPF